MTDYGMNKQEDICIILFRDAQLTAEFNGKKMRLKFPQFLGDGGSLPTNFISVVYKSKQ